MKTTTKRTTTTRVEGELSYSDLLAAVCKQLPTDRHTSVRINIFVSVPGGGDWSHTDLECETHPVQFTAEWTEEVCE